MESKDRTANTSSAATTFSTSQDRRNISSNRTASGFPDPIPFLRHLEAAKASSACK